MPFLKKLPRRFTLSKTSRRRKSTFTKVSELETELDLKQAQISNIEQELGDLQNQSDELQTANAQLLATNEELQQMNTKFAN